MVDRAGENSILVAPGANSTLRRPRPRPSGPSIAAADVLLCQLEIPVGHGDRRRAGRAGPPAPGRSSTPPRPASCRRSCSTTSTCWSSTRSRRRRSPARSATDMAALLALVPRVVLTLGGAGSRYADRDGAATSTIPAFRVEAADTTAAGRRVHRSAGGRLGRGPVAARRGALGERGRRRLRTQGRRLERPAHPRRDRRALLRRLTGGLEGPLQGPVDPTEPGGVAGAQQQRVAGGVRAQISRSRLPRS